MTGYKSEMMSIVCFPKPAGAYFGEIFQSFFTDDSLDFTFHMKKQTVLTHDMIGVRILLFSSQA
jgi:hypothetical protein